MLASAKAAGGDVVAVSFGLLEIVGNPLSYLAVRSAVVLAARQAMPCRIGWFSGGSGALIGSRLAIVLLVVTWELWSSVRASMVGGGGGATLECQGCVSWVLAP